jgi:aldose 1-epimerase
MFLMISLTVDFVVEEHDYPKQNNGKVEWYTLENANGAKLVVSNLGATVVSLWVKDKNNHLSDIILGYENKSDYYNDEFYFGAVVGRYANRIAGDTVVVDDVSYKISAKDAGYHLHGGHTGFDKKIFSVLPFHSDQSSSLRLKYISPHLEEGFPGELVFEVIYTLDDDDTWTVEYKASSSETTLVNFTQHAYFNLSGNHNLNIETHQLKINSSQYLPVNNLQVPKGVLENVFNTPFDFTTLKSIGKDINKADEQLFIGSGYDHTFVLEDKYSATLKHAATAFEANSGICLNVFTTEPSVHLYTGNYLKNIFGKYGNVYNKRCGFCLETQHFPDAPNHAHFPSTILKRGDSFYSKTIFKFSTV